ncbi:hypothetical protein CC80DRAFT_540642 [Byssothecium circinans]|uniref:BTB domain-containing protein n=1 Tax=Byssothecium circinans TaxID=147558 RepID=A0A6A5T8Q6_9PLEO|nr:hypothetical protein CC80DRAFT_540642 [Byssothecium circinans]
MAPAFEDFILSHQFTFFVGHEGKPVVVHAAAIAAASQQLDALINGGMEESETRCARLKDVRVDDFIRFCEYAYRGDYTVPSWEEVPPDPSCMSGTNQRNRDEDDSWTWGASKKKKSKKGRIVTPIWDEEVPATAWEEPILEPKVVEEVHEVPEIQPERRILSRTALRTQFHSRNYLQDGGTKALILQHFEPKPNSNVSQNFTPVLLAHARLYCFATLRLIAPLKALTLDKLHKTLMGFKLYTQRVGDIIELARYAYSNQDLPDRNDDGTVDDLRKLVVEYIVCEIDTIGKCDEFVRYMEDGGEFVGDFWKLARDYMA